MIELRGKYNTAKVFTDVIDSSTIGQVTALLNQEFVKNSQIRIMPDCHAGAGCVVGTTIQLDNKVVPYLVGSDIGCGMLVIKLKEKRINLPDFDSVIHKYIPSGFDMSKTDKSSKTAINIEDLRCFSKAKIDVAKAYHNVGTLGGGNHYIELDKDDDGNVYIVIHTGSRSLGKDICEYYQNLAYKKLKEKVSYIPFEMAYLEGQDFDDYIYDMKLVQQYAKDNRAEVARLILKYSKLTEIEQFETVHNYIDTDAMMLRKGAVSANEGEELIIPINMRDGALICVGKGNPDWNFSAPHGAGRLMSRGDAKRSFTVSEYKKTMKEAGIYTTSVGAGTLDECPMAYKPIESIIDNIEDTVEITKIITPIYNYKSGSTD